MLRARIGADDEPLLPPAAMGSGVDQDVDLGAVHAARVHVIGDDQHAPGGAGGPVVQKIRAESVTSTGEFTITGRRTGAPPRE